MAFPDKNTPGFMKAAWVSTDSKGALHLDVKLWLKSTEVVENSIYHYTDLNALIGIVPNNGLRLSDVRFLNDYQEYENGVILFESLAENKKVKDEKILFIKETAEFLRNADEVEKVFVTSFSTEPDILDMWRAYGKNGKGISIEFDNTNRKLEGYFGGLQYVHLGKVIYNDEIKLEILFNTAKRFTDAYHSCPYIKKYIDEKNTFLLEDTKKDYAKSLANTVKRYLALFKNKSFINEKEVRVVYKFNVDGKNLLYSGMKYRVSGNMIAPYFESKNKTFDPERFGKLPIKGIVVGPTSHDEATMLSIKEFMNDNGYPDINIRKSSCPYRG